MSQSKSLKADKELMWKKLSTPAKPPLPEFKFHDIGARGGIKPGEVIMFISGGGGKSYYTTKPLP